jgi:8-oxo-dGTP pyrophosphatase MutT (NUDIX family)
MESSALNAIGVWLCCIKTKRYLYLLRNDSKYPGSWGLPGGKIEPGETLLAAIERECREEMGYYPDIKKLIPIEQFTSTDQKFVYHTVFGIVENEFIPILNQEHFGYAWINSDVIPKPLHPGLWSTVNLEEVKVKIKTLESQISQ